MMAWVMFTDAEAGKREVGSRRIGMRNEKGMRRGRIHARERRGALHMPPHVTTCNAHAFAKGHSHTHSPCSAAQSHRRIQKDPKGSKSRYKRRVQTQNSNAKRGSQTSYTPARIRLFPAHSNHALTDINNPFPPAESGAAATAATTAAT